MIHQVIILYKLSTLRGYCAYAKIIGDLTLLWSYIPADWAIVNGKKIFLIEALWYLMGFRQRVSLGGPKDMWSWNLWL